MRGFSLNACFRINDVEYGFLVLLCFGGDMYLTVFSNRFLLDCYFLLYYFDLLYCVDMYDYLDFYIVDRYLTVIVCVYVSVRLCVSVCACVYIYMFFIWV